MELALRETLIKVRERRSARTGVAEAFTGGERAGELVQKREPSDAAGGAGQWCRLSESPRPPRASAGPAWLLTPHTGPRERPAGPWGPGDAVRGRARGRGDRSRAGRPRTTARSSRVT